MQTVGERIQHLIREKGMTQAALAKAAGVTRPTLNLIISNTTKGSRSETIAKIARALGVTADWLMSEEGLDGPPKTEERLTGRQRAMIRVMEAVDRMGWEEVARAMEAGLAADTRAK